MLIANSGPVRISQAPEERQERDAIVRALQNHGQNPTANAPQRRELTLRVTHHRW
jgi:hypothetical protein